MGFAVAGLGIEGALALDVANAFFTPPYDLKRAAR